MQHRGQGGGTAGDGPSGGGDVERDGPKFPHVDEIEIPEGLSVESAEPVRRSEDASPRRLRRIRSKFSLGIGRIGTGIRGLVDRILLVVTFVVPLLILAYQSFEWLRTARWPPVTLEGLLARTGATPGAVLVDGWPGLHGLLQLVLEAPLAAVLFIAGLSLHLLLSLLLPSIRRD